MNEETNTIDSRRDAIEQFILKKGYVFSLEDSWMERFTTTRDYIVRINGVDLPDFLKAVELYADFVSFLCITKIIDVRNPKYTSIIHVMYENFRSMEFLYNYGKDTLLKVE